MDFSYIDVEFNVEEPDRSRRRQLPEYYELRRLCEHLADGELDKWVKVRMPHERMVENGPSVVHEMARRLGAKEKGWRFTCSRVDEHTFMFCKTSSGKAFAT